MNLDKITLITGNRGKAQEYEELLGIDITAMKADLDEIQAIDVAQVARRKAQDAYALTGSPVLVDDTGLSVQAWNGLPGALITWFIDTVGPEGLLAMTAGLSDRRATATTVLGYADADGVQVFQGALPGLLAAQRRGDNGFGYDSIFIPEGSDQTFAEMTRQQKNQISHRRLAVEDMKIKLGLAAGPIRAGS